MLTEVTTYSGLTTKGYAIIGGGIATLLGQIPANPVDPASSWAAKIGLIAIAGGALAAAIGSLATAASKARREWRAAGADDDRAKLDLLQRDFNRHMIEAAKQEQRCREVAETQAQDIADLRSEMQSMRADNIAEINRYREDNAVLRKERDDARSEIKGWGEYRLIKKPEVGLPGESGSNPIVKVDK